MPREFGRNRRVARFIREELASLVQAVFPLGEYGIITLTQVDVSPDLRNATVFVTFLNESGGRESLLSGLNQRAGYFRHALSAMMTARRVPALRFSYDESVERARRLSDVIDSVSTRK